MDETPEELEQIRREADQIDVHQYRKRFRAAGRGRRSAPRWPGLVWLVMSWSTAGATRASACATTSASRIPPACRARPTPGILDESLHDESPQMRANIKAQCQSKIDRLKEEDGITVK